MLKFMYVHKIPDMNEGIPKITHTSTDKFGEDISTISLIENEKFYIAC